MAETTSKPHKLKKELGLFDVYAISTGAMFSSGFFLLPGLAAALTGPSVGLAYLVAGVFILPAMFSVAELATAMPKAGGAYYFLDRALGPIMGTVGGLGTWLALVLKSAFALVGMGAYLAIYVDAPIEPVAVGLTVIFMIVNVVGAKESGGLQRILVVTLLVAMGGFIIHGVAELAANVGDLEIRSRYTPFFAFGTSGFMGAVGFVFVSYAGLTKVASVAEEVRNPDRAIPLGMILSLATAALVYTVGVFIIVAFLPPEVLRDDLTPVATAAAAFVRWIPQDLGVGIIVVAAAAAFASTGNAGILSASRYPMAMARDKLVPAAFQKLGRFGTPTTSVIVTGLLMAAAIVLLDVASIAKLASAFQLLLFALLNLAVIIMRESGIEGYDPGFRSPLYPWMQIAGFLAPFWLIAEMGELAIFFTLGMVALTLGWYFRYAHPRVVRSGAIFHTFARLGTLRYEGLDAELRAIVKEKGLRTKDPFDEVVARAPVIQVAGRVTLSDLTDQVGDRLASLAGVPAEAMKERFRTEVESGFLPVAHGVALPHIRMEGIEQPLMLLVRSWDGISHESPEDPALAQKLAEARAAFFLVSPQDEPGQHLRLLGHLAVVVDDPTFLERWMGAETDGQLKEALLHEDRWIRMRVGQSPGTEEWVDRPLRDLGFPDGVLVALVQRGGEGFVPRGSTVLLEGDHLTLIGEPGRLETFKAGRP